MTQIIFYIILFAFPLSVQAAVIDTQEWETKPGAPWSYSAGQSGSGATVDCTVTPSPSGGCALKFVYPAGTYTTSFGGGRAERSLTGNPTDLYLGAWMRYGSPFQFHPVGHKVNLFYLSGTNGGCRNMSIGINYGVYDAQPQICWGGGTYSNPANITTWDETAKLNQWHWYEQHILVNTPGVADGVAEMWIDGVLHLQYTNIKFRDTGDTAGFGYFQHSAEYGGGGSTVANTQYWWVDHTVVSTTYIGVPSGAGGDSTPPTMPGSFAASAVNATSVSLSWTASTDTNLAGYRILGIAGATTPTATLTTVGPTALTYQDNTATANTQYTYAVRAYDVAGNLSPQTANSTVTTPTLSLTTLATVSFTQANATDIGAAWDSGYLPNKTNLQVVTNRLRGTTIGTYSYETYNAISAPDDQWARIIIRQAAASTDVAHCVTLRSANSPTVTMYAGCYHSVSGVNRYRIREYTDGVAQELAESTDTTAAQVADEVQFEAIGTALKVYRNRAGIKTLMASATDATLTTGKVGIMLVTGSGATLAAAEASDFATGGFDVGVVQPTITGLTLDATGASLTYGATTPTWIRVHEFTNGGFNLSTTWPISAFTAGRFTQTWRAGLSGACFYPWNSLGIENSNSSAYRCGSLVGIVAAADTTPIVLTQTAPGGSLNSGTTSTTFSVSLDKPATELRWGLTNVAFDSMTTGMNCAALQCSANTGAILSPSTTTHVYIQSRFLNSLDAPITSTSALDIAITVLGTAVDTTPPGTIADLTCAAGGQAQVTCSWPVASGGDIQGYQVYTDYTGSCANYVPAGSPTALTTTLLNLPPSTNVSIVVKAIDTSQNYSAANSNCQTVLTSAIADVIPPVQLTGLAGQSFSGSILLSWTAISDTATPVIEQSAAGCASFSTIYSGPFVTALSVNLSPGTTYCFRGYWVDQANNAGTVSDTLSKATLSGGLGRPPSTLPFGVTRPTPSTQYPLTRPQRP